MQASADPQNWVICLCAQWCGVCREWRTVFDAAAAEHAGVRFAWVDVEDDAETMGDIDVETFPTLLVARAGKPLFFGPVLPSAGHLQRLLASVRDADAAPAGVTAEVVELFSRLRGMLRN